MVQVNDTLNNNQIPPPWRWWRGLMFFLHRFMRLVLHLMLYHSGKLTIPQDHVLLLLQILHLFLFKSLQRQSDLRISGDSRVVFWCARDGNRRLSFLRRADLPFVRNVFFCDLFLSYFHPSVSKSSPSGAATMWRWLRRYRWQVNTFRDIEPCHWPRRWCAM